MYKKTISNSYVYEFQGMVGDITPILKKSLNHRRILVKIWEKYYIFLASTNDFTDDTIKEVYKREQIYINIHWAQVSHNFIVDYRKLKKRDFYFEIEKKNLFEISEKKVKLILEKIFLWDCLDIGCGDTRYKNIFQRKKVNYLWIDIHKVDNELPVLEWSFESFHTSKQFDTLFFFRSMNHFSNTSRILNKAYNILKPWGYLFVVENELFWELKFQKQMFEWKQSDFEHYYNYQLKDFVSLVINNNFTMIEKGDITQNDANQWYILMQKK